MNRYFDFTGRQLKFILVFSLVALVMAGYLFIRSYVTRTSQKTHLAVFIGEDRQKLTGLFIIDPNRSPVDSLELLPGIGPVLAGRIVDYRERTLFEREIDIINVRGIGPKLYERIEPYLKIQPW